MHKDTYVSKDKLSEEFKALVDVIDWRQVRGNDVVPAVLIQVDGWSLSHLPHVVQGCDSWAHEV